MKKTSLLSLVVLFSILYFPTVGFDFVDGIKTGSYNFCSQLPGYPECAGWRSEIITDDFWFCDYVYLEELCSSTPESEKELPLRTQDYCCRYIESELQKIQIEENVDSKDKLAEGLEDFCQMTDQQRDNFYENNPEVVWFEDRLDDFCDKEEDIREKEFENFVDDIFAEIAHRKYILTISTESILPLIIWTDKDHYNYRDKAIVYGKFDFTNPNLIQNINQTEFAQTGEISKKTFTVDIKLNGNEILREIPVNPNGWFSSFFYHNNSYNFSTQNNLLEVEYVITSGDTPLGGPKTHATYQFTTGDIATKDDSFEMEIDDSLLPNKILYQIAVNTHETFIELGQITFLKYYFHM